MLFATLLRRLSWGSGEPAVRVGHKRRPQFRPRLEVLEDRLAPALLIVNTFAGESTADNFLSLSEAVKVVNTQSEAGLSTAEKQQVSGSLGFHDTIQFDQSLNGHTIAAGLFIDRNLTITGPGASSLTVSGGQSITVFSISDSTVSISGLTIANGDSDIGSGIYNTGTLAVSNCTISGNLGGGIYNSGTLAATNCTLSGNTASGFGGGGGIVSSGTLTVNSCTFSGNTAAGGVGGGIRNLSPGRATVTSSTFINNAASLDGAGIFNDGTVEVTNCTCATNIAGGAGGGIANDSTGTATVSGCTFANNAGSGGGGGGIYTIGTATVSGCTFTNNTALFFGGGIDNDGGTATVTNCTLANNTDSFVGGGIYNGGTATTTVSGCTLTNNAAQLGGGMYNDGKATVSGCTLTNNAAQFGGGGIANGASLTVTNCTLANNTAVFGAGGIYNFATMTANNTIVAANQAPVSPDFSGALNPSSSFNLIGDGSGLTGISNGTQGNQVGTAASPINPLLGPLQDNGGATRTMALLPGSPAIDAGSNALAVDAGNNPLTTDQRGVARVINGTVDIGAFESRPFTIALTSGYGQRTTVNTGFLNPLVVTVTSAYGDPVRGGVVTFTAPTSGAGATFPASGSGAVQATIDPVGQAAVAVTANTVAGGYGVLASARGASFPAGFSLTNTPDAARTFVVSGFPSPTIAGVAHTLIVTAKDQYGNTATGYASVVRITSSDPRAALPFDALLTKGIGLFSVALKTAGTQSVTATDALTATLTGTQSGITVNPSVAGALIIAAPGTVAPGVPFSFTVTAVDAYGNVATGYHGTIKFSSSDKKALLPGNVTLTNGTGTFTATFKTKGPQTLTVTDVASSGLTDSLVVLVEQPKK